MNETHYLGFGHCDNCTRIAKMNGVKQEIGGISSHDDERLGKVSDTWTACLHEHGFFHEETFLIFFTKKLFLCYECKQRFSERLIRNLRRNLK